MWQLAYLQNAFSCLLQPPVQLRLLSQVLSTCTLLLRPLHSLILS